MTPESTVVLDNVVAATFDDTDEEWRAVVNTRAPNSLCAEDASDNSECLTWKPVGLDDEEYMTMTIERATARHMGVGNPART